MRFDDGVWTDGIENTSFSQPGTPPVGVTIPAIFGGKSMRNRRSGVSDVRWGIDESRFLTSRAAEAVALRDLPPKLFEVSGAVRTHVPTVQPVEGPEIVPVSTSALRRDFDPKSIQRAVKHDLTGQS
jgi:hypothetical protein